MKRAGRMTVGNGRPWSSRVIRFACLLIPALMLFAGVRTQAAATWGGGTSTDWNTAANWNAGGGPVPGVGDDVVIQIGRASCRERV